MNKFAILSILVVGLVAGASAASIDLEDSKQFQELSEFKIKPDDSGEVAFLAPEHRIFEDYCRRSRDLVYTYIQDQNKQMVANIFATFFGSINEVTEQLQEIQKSEAERAADAIKEGKIEPLNKETMTEEEIKEHIEKSAGLLRTVGGALANYAKALGQAAIKELMTRLTLLQKTFNIENFREVLQQTCTRVQLEMHTEVQKMFRKYKAEMKADELTPEQSKAMSEATYEKVGCLTTGRARKVANVCSVFNTAGPLVFTMMGI